MGSDHIELGINLISYYQMRETEERELLKTVARKIANMENDQNKRKHTQISFG